METEYHYPEEADIPEYYTHNSNSSSSRKNITSSPVEMMLYNDFNCMVECRNLKNWYKEEEERTYTSQQLESSQAVESIVSIKQEEEEDWFGNSIQEMFPDLAPLNIHDTSHETETIFPELQECNIKIEVTKPYEKLYENTADITTAILTETEIEEEKIAEAKGESEYKKLGDFPLNTEIKVEDQIIKTEINTCLSQPTTSKKAYKPIKKNTNIKKSNHSRKKKTDKKKKTNFITKTKQDEQKENVDIDFISNKTQGKGIEAIDLPSLLEKFEELENAYFCNPKQNLCNKSPTKDIPTSSRKSRNKTTKTNKQRTYRNKESKKALRQASKHKVIQEKLQEKFAELTQTPTFKLATSIHEIEQSEIFNSKIQCSQNDKNMSPNHVKGGISIDLEHNYCIMYDNNNPMNNKPASKTDLNKTSRTSDNIKEEEQQILDKQKQTDNNFLTINSVLARNILLSRQKGPMIEIQTGSKIQQMVSVLKKPPSNNTQQCSLSNNIEENMTTTNINDEIKNIIQHDTENMPLQDIKQPVRKINIEEYRRKRKQISNNDETNFSVQRKVVYIYHACTMTEPFKEGGKKVWSAREFNTVLKTVSETEKEKLKPKCCDVSVQTYETIFEFPGSSSTQNKKGDVAEGINKSDLYGSTKSRSRSRTRNKSNSRSSSRSRGRSKTRRTSRSRKINMHIKRRYESNRNRSKNRNRNSSTSKSRSGSNYRSSSRSSRSSSRRRHNTHNRLRRRSVSSSSTSSSCTSNARSRRRSRSSSYHSKSSSRYYSRCSRSPSTSNRRKYTRWSSDRERQYDRDRRYSRRETFQNRDFRRSPPQYYNDRSQQRRYYNDKNHKEWQRQVEERRVVYVGGIENGTTKADLHRRFEKFGRIVEISLHFRTNTVNFGFVTFEHKDDAYKAVECGNDDEPVKFHLSFGGRRAFCQVNYEDLDGAVSGSYDNSKREKEESQTFDDMLKYMMRMKQLV